MIRYAVHASLVAPEAWVDDGFGGREIRPLRKGGAPPDGYSPIPGGKHGGYRKRDVAGWVYWYPDAASATQAAVHHADLAKRAKEMGRRNPGTRAAFNTVAAEHKEHAEGAARFREHASERMEKAIHESVLRAAGKARCLGLSPEEVTAAREMESVGPPNEWSGGAAAALGEEHCKLYQRTWGKLDKEWRDDILSKFVQKMNPLHKGEPVALAETLRGPVEPGAVCFDVGDYLFRFRKAGRGLPILTVRGKGLPMPYHMVVKGLNDARARAPGVAEAFAAGKVPDEGVFRIDDDATVRVRYTDRTQGTA